MAAFRNDLLLIGHIGGAFGLRGDVRLHAETDRPDHLAEHIQTVYIGSSQTPYRLLRVHEHKPGVLLLKLEGLTSREDAEALRRSAVFIVQTEAAPLAADEYFLHELYGLRVETEDGTLLGEVREVLETGANEVLVVQRPDQQKDLLLPMTREVVRVLDPAGGRVVVRLLAGLLD